MSLTVFGCTKCSFEASRSDRLARYVLEGGRGELPVVKCFAWCDACRDVVAAETLSELASLEADLVEIEAASQAYFVGALAPSETWQMVKSRWVEEVRCRIMWRRSRQSPARCLECGAPEPIPFPLDVEGDEMPLPHPGCTGQLLVVERGLALDRSVAHYSPEGERIATFMASPSRGLVRKA